MKQFFIIAILFAGLSVNAQITTPAPSPTSTITQAIGLGEVTIEYSRPGMKDRAIFGADGLVPYGTKWRLGANRATKISFSDDVKVNGNDLAAGTYAVLATPTAANWEFEFHTHDTGSWSAYTDRTPVMKTTAKVNKMSHAMEPFASERDSLKPSWRNPFCTPSNTISL